MSFLFVVSERRLCCGGYWRRRHPERGAQRQGVSIFVQEREDGGGPTPTMRGKKAYLVRCVFHLMEFCCVLVQLISEIRVLPSGIIEKRNKNREVR